mgnify:FL=1
MNTNISKRKEIFQLKKKRNDYFKKLIGIIKQYPGLKNKNEVIKKWSIQLLDHIENADDKEITDTFIFAHAHNYVSDINEIYDKKSIKDFDIWIENREDKTDIKTTIDESFLEADECSSRKDWYAKMFSNDINQLKKWFIEEYCIENLKNEINETDELTDKKGKKLLLT